MIKLKNIHEISGNIVCDAFVEDCDRPVSLTLNLKNGQILGVTMPEGYEWCTAHIGHAKQYLLSAQPDLPAEKTIMWY